MLCINAAWLSDTLCFLAIEDAREKLLHSWFETYNYNFYLKNLEVLFSG